MASRQFFNVASIPKPISLTGCQHLNKYLPLVFPGWEFIPVEPDSEAVVSVDFQGGQYYLRTAWQKETQSCTEEVEIICALVAKLAKAQALSDLDSLYLHAGAVEFNGRLVVFPNRYRAGKSFLSVCLAAVGYKLFCDDVLPIGLDNFTGVAPGIAPMLRLPLPVSIDLASSEFIESHTVLRGRRYLYVNPGDCHMHTLGARVPVGAIVLLNRQDGASARIETVSAAEILRQTIWQNFAREVDAPRILGGLSQIVSQVECVRLVYDRADDAIKTLEQRFGRWRHEADAGFYSLPQSSAGSISIAESGGNRFVQQENVQVVAVDNENFLTSPDGKAIHHLNPMGSAIWCLLARPTSIDEIVSLLSAAFPDTQQETIRKDLKRLILNLISKKLVARQE